MCFVDTRFGRQVRAKSARSRKEEEKRVPALDRCIMTKYVLGVFTNTHFSRKVT